MLSFVDIKKELGKNIYIYPVYPSSIKANSIDLHASKFAWSLKTKKPLARSQGCHIVPPNDTALVYTEESIYVSHKIGGSYHSKVTLVSQGLGHIGTTLDAHYIGNSLIALHNHSNDNFNLRIGQELVTLHLFYLHSPIFSNEQGNDNDPGHPRMIMAFDKKSVSQYISWRDQNQWVTSQRALLHKMLDSDEYKQCKRDYEVEQRVFTHRVLWRFIRRITAVTFALLLVALSLAIPAYALDLGPVSVTLSKLCETFIYPAFAGILGAVITHSVLRYFKND